MFFADRSAQIADRLYEIQVWALQVVRHDQAGQFGTFRTDEKAGRIPPTISVVDGNSIRVIFPATGKIASRLASLHIGDHTNGIAGPSGKPGIIRHLGTFHAHLWGHQCGFERY